MTTYSEASPTSRPVILVVDDEPMVRDIAAQMLERAGYAVITAENGYQALQVRGPVQLIFCDLRMPGLSGMELRGQLLKARPGTPVILMSGDLPDNPGAEGIPYFLKPFTTRQIRDRVREEIERTNYLSNSNGAAATSG